jgi:hypothetical protein
VVVGGSVDDVEGIGAVVDGGCVVDVEAGADVDGGCVVDVEAGSVVVKKGVVPSVVAFPVVDPVLVGRCVVDILVVVAGGSVVVMKGVDPSVVTSPVVVGGTVVVGGGTVDVVGGTVDVDGGTDVVVAGRVVMKGVVSPVVVVGGTGGSVDVVGSTVDVVGRAVDVVGRAVDVEGGTGGAVVVGGSVSTVVGCFVVVLFMLSVVEMKGVVPSVVTFSVAVDISTPVVDVVGGAEAVGSSCVVVGGSVGGGSVVVLPIVDRKGVVSAVMATPDVDEGTPPVVDL